MPEPGNGVHGRYHHGRAPDDHRSEEVAQRNALGLYASYGRITQARILSAAAGTADRISVPTHTAKGGVDFGAPYGVQLNADASYISAVPYFAGTPLKLIYTRQYTRFDTRASKEYRGVELNVFATWQPVGFSAEAASAIAAGLLIDPRPRAIGISLSVRIAQRIDGRRVAVSSPVRPLTGMERLSIELFMRVALVDLI
jgi:hypothetical protein